jgi:hypothetical protein
MMAINDITGDNLISRTLSKEGEEQFDKIFGKKKTNGGWKPPSIDDAYEQEEKLERINKNLEGD